MISRFCDDFMFKKNTDVTEKNCFEAFSARAAPSYLHLQGVVLQFHWAKMREPMICIQGVIVPYIWNQGLIVT